MGDASFVLSILKQADQHLEGADAGALYCYWAVNELGTSLNELAARLNLTPAGVGYAVQRGERIVRENSYDLL